MARIDFYVNYELQASVRLDGPEVVVGRDPGCAVQIPNPKVSRRHAVIRAEGDKHSIENFGANGTKVNGTAIDSVQPLHPGDAIFISSYILVYQPDDAPAEELAQTVLVDKPV